jgi:hypothetical protein
MSTSPKPMQTERPAGEWEPDHGTNRVGSAALEKHYRVRNWPRCGASLTTPSSSYSLASRE